MNIDLTKASAHIFIFYNFFDIIGTYMAKQLTH